MNRVNWSAENARTLRELMVQSGLDSFTLAKIAAMSAAQASELLAFDQSSDSSCFYTQAIKAHAGNMLIEKLKKYSSIEAREGVFRI